MLRRRTSGSPTRASRPWPRPAPGPGCTRSWATISSATSASAGRGSQTWRIVSTMTGAMSPTGRATSRARASTWSRRRSASTRSPRSAARLISTQLTVQSTYGQALALGDRLGGPGRLLPGARSGQLQRVGGQGQKGDRLPRVVAGLPSRGQGLLVQLEPGSACATGSRVASHAARLAHDQHAGSDSRRARSRPASTRAARSATASWS